MGQRVLGLPRSSEPDVCFGADRRACYSRYPNYGVRQPVLWRCLALFGTVWYGLFGTAQRASRSRRLSRAPAAAATFATQGATVDSFRDSTVTRRGGVIDGGKQVGTTVWPENGSNGCHGFLSLSLSTEGVGENGCCRCSSCSEHELGDLLPLHATHPSSHSHPSRSSGRCQMQPRRSVRSRCSVRVRSGVVLERAKRL